MYPNSDICAAFERSKYRWGQNVVGRCKGRRVAGVIRSLVSDRDLQIECARVLHETLLVPVLNYASETVLRKEEERSRIKAVQMDNLRGLLGIRRMDNPECMDKAVVRSDEQSRYRVFSGGLAMC